MTVITPDRFDALKRYVGVRLQQGVPIVDADWNELEDARRFELRSFLKWFVGDGVPSGNDGFRIVGTGAVDDFTISSGVTAPVDPVRNIGRIIVDGLDVMIEGDIGFKAQKLHKSQGAGADAEAAKLGFPGSPVPKIDDLPAVVGTVTVYLDVWERLVTPTEAPSLVLPGLGTESCARKKREWVVRARQGSNLPASADPDFIAGHSYYALARIARQGAGAVNAADVTDRREQKLVMVPGTIVSDTVGGSLGQYRFGGGRPLVSLREAINALMRGELPSTADAAVSPASGKDIMRRAFAFDGAGGLVATWASARGGGGINQIYATRLDLANITAGFPSANPITSGVAHDEVALAVLPNHDVVAAYTVGSAGARDIKFKRGPLTSFTPAAPAETDVATTAAVERTPSVVVAGNRLTFFYSLAGGGVNTWQVRVFDLTAGNFPAGPQALAGVAGQTDAGEFDLHAAVDTSNNVWTAWSATGDHIHLLTYTQTGNRVNESDHSSGTSNMHPFVLCAHNNVTWLFWQSSNGIVYDRFSGGAWSGPTLLALPDGRDPAAVETPDGGIWLFWTRGPAATGDIAFARIDPVTGNFATERPVTTSPTDDAQPFAIADQTGAMWTFWNSDRLGDYDVFYKRFLTQI